MDRDVGEGAKLAYQLADVHAGATVDVGRPLTREDPDS
jgi:hypothetical protein